MKKYFLIIITLLFGINSKAQTFELFKGDTINRTDISGQKQGLWIYFESELKDKIAQKGKYINNRKEDIWETYHSNGKLKSSITYKTNKPDGYAKIFYESGVLCEEGLWKGNRWVGQYKYYHDNGNTAYIWTFNEEGKRTGEQKYFYENGQLKIEGTWNEGKEQGVIKEYYASGKLRVEGEWKDGKADGTTKEYYETGNLKAEKKFNNGVFDESSAKYYARQNETIVVDIVDTVKQNNNNMVNNNLDAFTGNGFHKLYNRNKQLEQEGEFKNGRLVTGKRLYYDENGKLSKTAIYEDGVITKVVKEGEHE